MNRAVSRAYRLLTLLLFIFVTIFPPRIVANDETFSIDESEFDSFWDDQGTSSSSGVRSLKKSKKRGSSSGGSRSFRRGSRSSMRRYTRYRRYRRYRLYQSDRSRMRNEKRSQKRRSRSRSRRSSPSSPSSSSSTSTSYSRSRRRRPLPRSRPSRSRDTQSRRRNRTILETTDRIRSFSTLNALISRDSESPIANILSQENGEFTLFAPLDSAFRKFFGTTDLDSISSEELTELLQYHVLEGKYFRPIEIRQRRKLMVMSNDLVDTFNDGLPILLDLRPRLTVNKDANIVGPEIVASNGIIHAIDKILLPPQLSIAELIDDAEDFTILLELLEIAELADIIADDTAGPFTLLAPTDKAFARLGTEVLDILLDDVDALADILRYHVITNRIPSARLKMMPQVTMLNDQIVQVDRRTLNDDARIIEQDLLATNGIVHVINRVLIPDSGGGGDDDDDDDEDDDGDSTDSPTMPAPEPPMLSPSDSPILGPSESPVLEPTDAPMLGPSESPALGPTESPILGPTETPVDGPTELPVDGPSQQPTVTQISPPDPSVAPLPTSGVPTSTVVDSPSLVPPAIATTSETVSPAPSQGNTTTAVPSFMSTTGNTTSTPSLSIGTTTTPTTGNTTSTPSLSAGTTTTPGTQSTTLTPTQTNIQSGSAGWQALDQCEVIGDFTTCPIASDFELEGEIASITADLLCPNEVAWQTNFAEASRQDGVCTCRATKNEAQDIQCNCILCPEGSAIQFGYSCTSAIIADCTTISCDGQCNVMMK